MKQTIPCEVVQDLLPSYIEELTSPASNTYIKEHLAECAACNEIYENMKPASDMQEAAPMTREIDYLKRVKKKQKRNLFAAIAICVLLAAGFFALSPYLFSKPLQLGAINYTADVEGTHLDFTAVPLEDGIKISKVDVTETEPGVLELSLESVKALPWSAGNALELINGLSFDASKEITQVICDSNIIWYQNQTISRITSEVYNSRHAYIGDMPANTVTADALNLGNYLGTYSNELETSTTPYIWTLKMNSTYSSAKREQLEARMRGYAYAMLAVIDNLDMVRFTYNIDQKEACVLIVSKKEATTFAGADIKEVGKNPGLLQNLMEKSGLAEEKYYTEEANSQKAEEGTINLTLINMTEEELGSIGIRFYIGEGNEKRLVSSTTCMNADESKMKSGEYLKSVLLPQDFGLESFSEAEELYVGISLTDEIPSNGSTYQSYDVEQEIKVTPETVETILLKGSFTTGFTAEQKK